MLRTWKYSQEVIVKVGICGGTKQQKIMSQIGVLIRIIQLQLNVEKVLLYVAYTSPVTIPKSSLICEFVGRRFSISGIAAYF